MPINLKEIYVKAIKDEREETEIEYNEEKAKEYAGLAEKLITCALTRAIRSYHRDSNWYRHYVDYHHPWLFIAIKYVIERDFLDGIVVVEGDSFSVRRIAVNYNKLKNKLPLQ